MFTFRQFRLDDSHCGMKLSTDSVALGAWVDASGCRRAVDIGAGSGVLSLMLAQRYPDLAVVGVEIDPEAAGDCTANFAASPWSDRLRCVCADADVFGGEGPFDLLISNPPYFTTGLRAGDSLRAQARHEASLDMKTLLRLATDLLTAEGSLAIIIPSEREADYIFEAELSGLKLWRHTRLIACPGRKPLRSMLQFTARLMPLSVDTLTIRMATGELTPEFDALTEAFYLPRK